MPFDKKRPRLRTLRPRVPLLDLRRVKPMAKEADPHYHTREHREWRDAVIRRAGGRCQWPGCDRAEATMFADHIDELKDGGRPFDLDNGQCLCGSHHSLKTNQAKARRQARG